MKKALVARRNSRAFTLVELLTVIAIIGLLVSILLPGIIAVREAARKTRARADVRAIENAFKMYYADYTRWPTNLVGNDRDPNIENTVQNPNWLIVTNSVLKMLAGQNTSSNNPRLKVFMELPPSIAGSPDLSPFTDPWGNGYRYMCDFNYDGNLVIKFGDGTITNLVNTGVSVWSPGKNHTDGINDKDDVRSWQ
jgi:prepilin-type N-terminal cleavage/methylation domain-containing protein